MFEACRMGIVCGQRLGQKAAVGLTVNFLQSNDVGAGRGQGRGQGGEALFAPRCGWVDG